MIITIIIITVVIIYHYCLYYYYYYYYYYWRVSEASETLSGVTQLKIGDICLCLDVRMSFLYFDPGIFVLIRWLAPSQTSLNRILRFIDHYQNHPRN